MGDRAASCCARCRWCVVVTDGTSGSGAVNVADRPDLTLALEHFATEDAAGVGDRAARAGVAVGDERHDVVERDVVAVAGAQQREDRAPAGHHLQAAAVAAAADGSLGANLQIGRAHV